MIEKPPINNNHVEDSSKRKFLGDAAKIVGGLAALSAFGYARFNKREAERDKPQEKTAEEIITEEIESIEYLIRDVEKSLEKINPKDQEEVMAMEKFEENKKTFFVLIAKHESSDSLKVTELESIKDKLLQDQLRIMNLLR